MPASNSRSCANASCKTAAGKSSASRAGPARSAAAMRCALAFALSLHCGETLFQFRDAAMEMLDLSIASARCRASGRGPRRRSGAGAWRSGIGVEFRSRRRRMAGRMASRRRKGLIEPARKCGQHCPRCSRPYPKQALPCLLHFSVEHQRGKLALPECNPVSRERMHIRIGRRTLGGIRGVHGASCLFGKNKAALRASGICRKWTITC